MSDIISNIISKLLAEDITSDDVATYEPIALHTDDFIQDSDYDVVADYLDSYAGFSGTIAIINSNDNKEFIDKLLPKLGKGTRLGFSKLSTDIAYTYDDIEFYVIDASGYIEIYWDNINTTKVLYIVNNAE